MSQVQTAADKRAARRARVLQSGESRLNMLKGHTMSLEVPQAHDLTEEQRLDEGVDELLASGSSGSELADQPAELKMPPRIDPAQRRREAASRRRRNEQLVQEMLHVQPPVGEVTLKDQKLPQQLPNTLDATSATTKSTSSRHLTALKLRLLEERIVIMLIVTAAIYTAMCMDLRSIAASLAAEDELFVSYQDLITKGASIDSIRQRFEREHVGPEMRQQLKQFVSHHLEMEAMSKPKSSSGWLPDVADFQFFVTSLMAHPPIVLCVLVLRLLLSVSMKAIHTTLDLPDVKSSDEGNLGLLANMVLSNQPVLKEFLVQGRKSLDDVFIFIFVLVISVTIRCIWLD